MYMARKYSGAGLREIVNRLGARDLSTVSHGVRRAEARLKGDREFRRLLKNALAPGRSPLAFAPTADGRVNGAAGKPPVRAEPLWVLLQC
jgi:hypothetical protein